MRSAAPGTLSSIGILSRLIPGKANLATKAAFQLIAVSADVGDELSSFMAENLIEVDRIIPAEVARLGIQATPAVLLVNSQGRVESSWRGAMRSADESAFLEILRKSP
jgi:hypothetical protein